MKDKKIKTIVEKLQNMKQFAIDEKTEVDLEMAIKKLIKMADELRKERERNELIRKKKEENFKKVEGNIKEVKLSIKDLKTMISMAKIYGIFDEICEVDSIKKAAIYAREINNMGEKKIIEGING